MFTGVKLLPSGYWAAWIDGDWIDAASASREEAEEKLSAFMTEAKKHA